MVVGVGVAVGVGVGGGTAVGVGVVLIALSSVSAGVVVTGVETSEPPQAAMHARMRRGKRVRANCRGIALPRLVESVDGHYIEGVGGMGGVFVGNTGVLGIRYFLWWKRIPDLGKAGGWLFHSWG